MRRTSIGSGQAISASALKRLNDMASTNKVAMEHEVTTTSLSHLWVPIYERDGNVYDWQLAKIVERNPPYVSVSVGDDFYTVEESKTQVYDRTHGEAVEDLATMNNLAQGPLLDVLRRRYYNDKIYTFVGDILISFNPYVVIPGLYDHKPISPSVTSGASAAVRKDPHVFTVAERAYCNMRQHSRSQSLVVSGESGAGKTEACKRVMTYLTAISRARSNDLLNEDTPPSSVSEKFQSVEEKVLRCNPFLEAFGNAKTNRNDNSSRFGKFLRLEYNDGRIIGANMKHYLLEKSRIVEPGPGERSYHIFYQLMRGASHEQRLSMGNLPQDVSHFHYLNKSGCDTVENMDDVSEFKEVIEALKIVGVSDDEMSEIWKALSAVLSLGNIVFDGGDEDGDDDDSEAQISHESEAIVEHVANMLGTEEVGKWIRQRQVGGGRSSIVIKVMNVMNATDARDALAKAIYSKIFDWLVEKVNKSLHMTAGARSSPATYIGILDIFGFEIFEQNSFEQLCINFCNEKLQMIFNDHVFNLEAKIYKDEGINVSSIEFRDNKDCVSLIEQKPFGLLSIMDDAYRRGTRGGTDDDLLKKFDAEHSGKKAMKKHPGASSFYDVPRVRNVVKGTDGAFVIKHFAGDVTYKIHGFLEKNRDALHGDLLMCMQDSSKAFIAGIFNGISHSSSSKRPSSKPARSRRMTKIPDSIAHKFKNQLHALNNELHVTEPHYIRCIKTNSRKAVHYFEPNSCLRQLVFAGVLECVRIRREGFPFRKSFEEFWAMCTNQGIDKCLPDDVPENATDKIASQIVLRTALPKKEADGGESLLWQIGKTRIFMRDGVYETLLWWQKSIVARTGRHTAHRTILILLAYLLIKERECMTLAL